jgi:hypothetical protein
MHMLARTALTLITSGILSFALVLTAFAAVGNYGGYTHDAVNIRAWSTVSSTSYGLGYPSHTACLTFSQEGDVIEGNPWWNYHRNFTTGVEGYSSEAYMYLSSPLTQCNW